MTTTSAPMSVLNEADYRRHQLPEDLASFGALQTAQGGLPLTDMALEGRVEGLIYDLKLRQRFFNPHAQPLEAIYVFPLPGRAAVGSFVMETRDRRVVGKLEERGAARQQYQAAIAAGKQAALAEEDRAEVFTITVGNIPPGEAVTIELTLDGPMIWADGQAMFRFPLVVAPRYMPGAPLGGQDVGAGFASDTTAVPDASRISPPLLLPGYPNPVRLSVDLRVVPGGLRLGAPQVSLADLVAAEDGEGLKLTLRPLADRLDRDLIVRFPLAAADVEGALHVQADGDAQVFALDLVPDAAHRAGPAKPRQVVALLDRSGSMEGWKMVCARRAVGRLVDALVDADAFAVLTFDDQVEPLDAARAGLRAGSDRERFLAVEQLGGIEARGGTEILLALQAGVAMLKGQPGACLLLITDGQVGNEAEVLAWVQRHAQGVRIFPVGVDQAVNAGLLEQLAQVSGGVFTLVESEAALDQAMDGLRQRIGRPLLHGLHVALPGAVTEVVGPRELFAGAGTRLMGRCTGSLPATVEVRGTWADGSAFSKTVPVAKASGGMVAKLWARARVQELEHGFLAGWSDPACTPAAIAAFALRHGVLCRFTAFVAIDQVRKVEGPLRQVTQPVSQPAGWAPVADAEEYAEGSFDDMADMSKLSEKSARGGAFGMAAPSPCAPPPPPLGGAAPAPRPASKAAPASSASGSKLRKRAEAPPMAPGGGGPVPKPAPAAARAQDLAMAFEQEAPAPAPQEAPEPQAPLPEAVQAALEAFQRAATPGDQEAAFAALVAAVAAATGHDEDLVRAALAPARAFPEALALAIAALLR